MHFSTIVKSILIVSASGVMASPIVKRASISDEPFGYASLNGGTTGGSGGTTVSVSTLDDLVKYAKADGSYIIYITKDISGAEAVTVTSDKTIVGKTAGVTLNGVGFYLKEGTENVIIRNLAIEKVIAPNDAVSLKGATNVWVDHIDASSDMDHDKDYYDGLVDITHASDYVTVSNCYLHDHWKSSLVGHSDSNGDEDTGHLTVTFGYNYWENLNSRCPSYRFGTGHFFNNYLNSVSDGVNIRDGAKLLVENNVFVDADKTIYSVDGTGYADMSGNELGGVAADVDTTSLSMSYDYTLKDASAVEAYVKANAGAILSF